MCRSFSWRSLGRTTRLSLIDVASATLVNTVEIRQFYDDPNDREHSFVFPFFGPEDWYYVPTPNANHEGKPRVLNLRNLTGEGAAGQFPVFEYAACGVARSSVFGYSPKSDHVVQYPVEIIEAGEKLERALWGLSSSEEGRLVQAVGILPGNPVTAAFVRFVIRYPSIRPDSCSWTGRP